MRHSRYLFFLFVLLLLGLIVRVVGAVYWQEQLVSSSIAQQASDVESHVTATKVEPHFYFGDSLSYWTLGRCIARGEPYEYTESRYTIFRTPGYPLLLAPIFLLWNDPPELAFRLESILFSMLGIQLVLWWVHRLYISRPSPLATQTINNADRTADSTDSRTSDHSHKRSVRSGLLLCAVATFLGFSPSAIMVSILVLTEAAFIPLMLTTLILWSLATERNTWKSQVSWAFLAGMMSGLATLVRPSWLFFPIGAIGFFLLFGLGIPRRRHLIVASGLVLGTLCVMAPWWIRNFQISGRLILTTLQQGTSLLDGWNPTADGSSRWEPVQAEIDQLQRSFESTHHHPVGEASAAERVAFECQMNDHCARIAKQWAAEHPWQALRLAVKKIGRFWNPIPNEKAFRKTPILCGLLLCYLPVLLAAMGCIWRETVWLGRSTRRKNQVAESSETAYRRLALWLCTLPLFYFTAMHAIFVSSIRYREPLWPLLVILAVGILAPWWLKEKISTKKPRHEALVIDQWD